MADRTISWIANLFKKANEDGQLELETRFCDQFQGQQSENPSDFVVGINLTRFSEVLRFYENTQTVGQAHKRESETFSYLSKDALQMFSEKLSESISVNLGSIRLVHSSDMPTVVTKTKEQHLFDNVTTIFPEGFKLSFSKEVQLSDEDALYISQTLQELPQGSLLTRKKDRISFEFSVQDEDHNDIPVIRVDFTTIDMQRYEIELEYIGNKNAESAIRVLQSNDQLLKSAARMFFEKIQQLLCLIHNSPVPLNIKHHNAVIRSYMTMVDLADASFVGCQPETLHHQHLGILTRESYFCKLNLLYKPP
jgi:hypothetical protein